jgi:hypothetical protein
MKSFSLISLDLISARQAAPSLTVKFPEDSVIIVDITGV